MTEHVRLDGNRAVNDPMPVPRPIVIIDMRPNDDAAAPLRPLDRRAMWNWVAIGFACGAAWVACLWAIWEAFA